VFDGLGVDVGCAANSAQGAAEQTPAVVDETAGGVAREHVLDPFGPSNPQLETDVGGARQGWGRLEAIWAAPVLSGHGGVDWWPSACGGGVVVCGRGRGVAAMRSDMVRFRLPACVRSASAGTGHRGVQAPEVPRRGGSRAGRAVLGVGVAAAAFGAPAVSAVGSVGVPGSGLPAAAAVGAAAAGRYVNPVSTPGAASFPDPSVVHGKDGLWYAFGTSDPILRGGAFPQIPILRSVDLVKLVGQVFPGARPSWVTATAGLWAPDIRFVDGHYVLYYVATDTVALPGSTDSAIGVATAPTPLGPWTDSGGPLVAPRPGNGSYLGTIDPAGFTDTQGRRWLYWSSFNGSGFVTRLTADGVHTVAAPNRMVGSTRGCIGWVEGRARGDDLVQRSGGCLPAEGLARPGVQPVSDRVEIGLGVDTQVTGLGQVLAQQAVGRSYVCQAVAVSGAGVRGVGWVAAWMHR